MDALRSLLRAAPLAPAPPKTLSDRIMDVVTMPLDPRAVSPHNPHFIPLPDSKPIPLWAAVLPPLSYYLALTLLPPLSGGRGWQQTLATAFRFALAIVSVIAFAVLPFWYHVPGSAILSYQLGLVGCYGACRVFDVFFLSYPRVPRRLRLDSSKPTTGSQYPSQLPNNEWPLQEHPVEFGPRLWWALDLLISMRGVGWDYASPDVRHDTNPWQPPSRRQLQRALFKIGPALAICLVGMRAMTSLVDLKVHPKHASDYMVTGMSITRLPMGLRPLFVAFTGISLYALFDFGYTIASALAMPIFGFIAPSSTLASAQRPSEALHNVDFFPLLNPVNLTELRSVRCFWSKCWHRLFHRAFLVYGVLPFQRMALLIEYGITYTVARIQGRQTPPSPFVDEATSPSPARHADPGRVLNRGQGDWGKVVGAFVASGVIHAISERAALGGRLALPPQHPTVLLRLRNAGRSTGALGSGIWSATSFLPPFSGAGEFTFFLLNGLAVVIEAVVGKIVKAQRRKTLYKRRSAQTAATATATTSTSMATSLGSKKSARSRVNAANSASTTDDEEEVPRKVTNFDAEPSSSASAASSSSNPSKEPISEAEEKEALKRWYDIYIQLTWTLLVLLTSGELFVEGWLASGLVDELTFRSH